MITTSQLWFYFGILGVVAAIVSVIMVILNSKSKEDDDESRKARRRNLLMPWLVYSIICLVFGAYTYYVIGGNNLPVWFYYGMVGATLGVITMTMALLDDVDDDNDNTDMLKYNLPWIIYSVIAVILLIYNRTRQQLA